MKEFTIDLHTWQRMLAYVDNCNIEISGWGFIDKNNHIYDIFITKQECSSAESTVDMPDLHQYMAGLMETNPDKLKDLRFHWHSHVNMQVFWSGTDDTNINGFTSGWMLFAVLNKSHKMKTKLVVYNPIQMHIDDVDIIPLENTLPDIEISVIKDEIEAKVTQSNSLLQKKLGNPDRYNMEKDQYFLEGYGYGQKYDNTILNSNNNDLDHSLIATYESIIESIKNNTISIFDLDCAIQQFGISHEAYDESDLKEAAWKLSLMEELELLMED